MARVKKGPIIIIASAIIVVVLLFAFMTRGSEKTTAENSPASKNPYITTAAIVKIPISPISATQEEKGYKLVIVGGFTSTETVFDLTNVYGGTTVSGTKQIIVGTLTTKIIENASYDKDSSVWTVYRTTMDVSKNTVTSFTTNNYQPLFDVLKYYYLSPHYITYIFSKHTTPIVYIYSGDGILTIMLEPTAIEYLDQITYTTTINTKVYTIISVVTGEYYIQDAKYATEILPSS